MNRQRGFNLIEMMVTVAVIGVLLGVGVPGMQAYIYNNRLTTQVNSLSTALSQARSEAIKVNQRVVVCVSSDGAVCDAIGGGTLWSKGWLVFVDRDANGVINLGLPGVDNCATGSTTDCVLTVLPAFTGTNTLTPAAGVKDFVAYMGDGSLRCNTNADPANLGTCTNSTTFFTLCDFRGAAYGKALSISKTGRVAVLDKQPNGSALVCP